MGPVITRDIREDMARDWDAARRAKDLYWGDRISRLGPAEGLRVAEQLRLQAIARNPAWPSAEDREADARAHLRLAERLHRASPARRSRTAR
jgi:hypothetical protein